MAILRTSTLLAVALTLVAAVPLAAATSSRPRGGTQGDGAWAIPEEARGRPPLMPWQRSLEDALALSRSSGKPLLVCVNVDGEPASERLAADHYTSPEFVELARGFIPVLASPDTHAPRERDDRGRRLPDPRFGRLVCSEHVTIEPELFERWFDGHRVAPRHVGVSAAGEILFDIYLVQDLREVERKLKKFGVRSRRPADPATLDLEALLASPDAAHREELERRFVAAETAEREGLAAAALSAERDVQHPELVHLALRDDSAAVRRAAAEAVAALPEHVSPHLLPAARAAAEHDPELRRAFVAAAERAAQGVEGDARRAAELHTRAFAALERASASVDLERWRLAAPLAPRLADPGPEEIDECIDAVASLDKATRRSPKDVELWLACAAARMRLARANLAAGQNPTFFFQDVIAAASKALELEPESGRGLGLHAWASWMLGDSATAREFAARAVPRLSSRADTPLAWRVLDVLARASTSAVYGAVSGGEAWPEGAARDARAAYEVLLAKRDTEVGTWTAYLGLLGTLGAPGAQADVLRRGLERFPLAREMHEWLRFLVLRDEGARALERAYEEAPLAAARELDPASLTWYQGLASFHAARQDEQNRDASAAAEAYRRSRELFARSTEAAPDNAWSAAYYRCLSLAAEADLQAAEGRHRDAVETLVEAAREQPAGAEFVEFRSPAEVAGQLARSLREQGEGKLARELEERLAELPARPGGGAPDGAGG